MTEKEYREHPAISRSELWRMNESPEKFKWFKDHPIEPTPALLFGQLTHKLLLQPESFNQEFVVAPAVDRRTKAGREEYDAFLSSVGNHTIVSQDDYDKAMACIDTGGAERISATSIIRSGANGIFSVPVTLPEASTTA